MEDDAFTFQRDCEDWLKKQTGVNPADHIQNGQPFDMFLMSARWQNAFKTMLENPKYQPSCTPDSDAWQHAIDLDLFEFLLMMASNKPACAVVDNEGKTALHKIASKCDVLHEFKEILTLCLQNSPYDNPWEVVANNGQTVLHVLAGRLWILENPKEILSLIVDPCPFGILVMDKNGKTPLDYCPNDEARDFLQDTWDALVDQYYPKDQNVKGSIMDDILFKLEDMPQDLKGEGEDVQAKRDAWVKKHNGWVKENSQLQKSIQRSQEEITETRRRYQELKRGLEVPPPPSTSLEVLPPPAADDPEVIDLTGD